MSEKPKAFEHNGLRPRVWVEPTIQDGVIVEVSIMTARAPDWYDNRAQLTAHFDFIHKPDPGTGMEEEAVWAELRDFMWLEDKHSRLLCQVTGDQLSDSRYSPEVEKQVTEDYMEKQAQEAINDHNEWLIDQFEGEVRQAVIDVLVRGGHKVKNEQT